MITLLKLGGSLITDKTKRSTFLPDVVERVGVEVKEALIKKSDLQLVIGHGSGSFGHFEAAEHGTAQGVNTTEQWQGFTRVATVAAELNMLVAKKLHELNLPILRMSPSTSALAEDGIITFMNTATIVRSLEHDLIPLVHGDVVFDVVRGGTIASTETVFAYLTRLLPVSRIILLGEVDGVYDSQGNIIPEITPENYEQIADALGGSAGVDVTGGMLTKVQDMLNIARQPPHAVVHICNGNTPGLVRDVLTDNTKLGTLIHAIPS